ncbi:hypothetical protein ACEUA0_14435 [Aeromonas veronii]
MSKQNAPQPSQEQAFLESLSSATELLKSFGDASLLNDAINNQSNFEHIPTSNSANNNLTGAAAMMPPENE